MYSEYGKECMPSPAGYTSNNARHLIRQVQDEQTGATTQLNMTDEMYKGYFDIDECATIECADYEYGCDFDDAGNPVEDKCLAQRCGEPQQCDELMGRLSGKGLASDRSGRRLP
eukprot:SAG11_NODE_5127_length_1657_cov_1.477535_2_plen_113_part_01